MPNRTAADALRSARQQCGLTQAAVARAAGTAQSAIAAYEKGTRQPTLPVFERLLAATGHVLRLDVQPDPTIFTLADLALALSVTDDDSTKLRLFYEFLRGAAESVAAVELLITECPTLTGDPRYDALVAATADDLAFHHGIASPPWTRDPGRILDGLWWMGSLPSQRSAALVNTPAAYRLHGVMIDRYDLAVA